MSLTTGFRIFPVLLLILATACTGSPAVTDLEGKSHHPLQASPGGAVVLIFITTDCPIANQCIPEINRIHETYREKNVELLLVHVDPEVTRATAESHARDYDIRAPIVLDPGQDLVRATGAKVTPEAAIFDASATMVYRGRINDRFPGLGDSRARAKVHDLREALDAMLAGRPVREPRTRAIGCYIPDLPR